MYKPVATQIAHPTRFMFWAYGPELRFGIGREL
jgi:hypothetical protein